DAYGESYPVRVFFQAEDGIRDFHVTGVQTCALPIYPDRLTSARAACYTPVVNSRLNDSDGAHQLTRSQRNAGRCEALCVRAEFHSRERRSEEMRSRERPLQR